ncbi:MAG TPA: acyltransferase family protein [Candidatus Acidoferrum sp.]|nr:acyltransferase family protein [Candidatus Acidoferrum sp.]
MEQTKSGVQGGRERLFYMDVLRVLACVFVVGNHTLGSVFADMEAGSTQTALVTWFFVCKTGVPLFLMMSGALVMRGTPTYRSIFKKTGQLVLVLTLASTYVWQYQMARPAGFELPAFLLALFRDPILLNYWYLYTAVGLYLMTPLLCRMAQNLEGADFAWYMLLWMLFGGLLPMLPLYAYPAVSSHLYLPLFSSYLGYYIAGYCLAWRERGRYDGALAAVFSFSMGFSGFYLVSSTLSEQGGGLRIRLLLDNARYLPFMLLSAGLFFILRGLLEGQNIPKFLRWVFAKVADATFGVYILHSILIPYFADKRIELFSTLPKGQAVASYTSLVFVSALILALFAKEIPVIKKLL